MVDARRGLRRDIELETRVTSAVFDEGIGRWTIETDRGDRVAARFCIMATGCLSEAQVPDFKGIETFEGRRYHTGKWPHEGVDFTGRRVGIIGTGSSAIQSIPIIATQAAQLFVFQRTPNYSIPANNAPLDPDYERQVKDSYADFVAKCAAHPLARAVKLADLEDNSRLDRTLLRPASLRRDLKRIERYQLSYKFLTGEIDERQYREAMRGQE